MNWKKRSKEKINEKFLQKFKIPSCQNTGAVFALIDDSRTIKKVVAPSVHSNSSHKINLLKENHNPSKGDNSWHCISADLNKFQPVLHLSMSLP